MCYACTALGFMLHREETVQVLHSTATGLAAGQNIP